MKLCMQLLARSLAPLEPRLFIKDGTAEIDGLHLFFDELPEIRPRHLYVGNAVDAFASPDGRDSVLIVSGRDMMLIPWPHTLEAVLNCILSAFDDYNRWEAELLHDIGETDPIRRLVEHASALFDGAVAVSDVDGNIHALASPPELLAQDPMARQAAENQCIPLEIVSMPIYTAGGEPVPQWADEPRLYKLENGICYIGSYVRLNGETAAVLYIQRGSYPMTEGDLLPARVLLSAVRRAIDRIGSDKVCRPASTLAELLDGETVTPEALARATTGNGLRFPLEVMVIRNRIRNSNIVHQRQMVGTIRKFPCASLSFSYENDVLVVCPAVEAENLLALLRQHIDLRHYCIGISLPFAAWSKLRACYRQAIFAIQRFGGEAGVFQTRDCALEFLLEQLHLSEDGMDFRHPAIEILRCHDRAHGTDYLRTLATYMRHERNTVAAAAALFLHRNSLAYRLRRIFELIGTQLDDPGERLYLNLSLLLDAREPPPASEPGGGPHAPDRAPR